MNYKILSTLVLVCLLANSVEASNKSIIEIKLTDRSQAFDLINRGLDVIRLENDTLTAIVDSNQLAELGDYSPAVVYQRTERFIFPSEYYTVDEAYAELNQTSLDHSNITRLIEIGSSYENRTLWAVKITDNPDADEGEPKVLYIGAHHARESITVSVALYWIRYLTDNYGNDSIVTSLVDSRELWVVPVLNPDGHIKVEEGDDTWRKNTRPNKCSNEDDWGADLNRNYNGSQNNDSNGDWGGVGTSSNPCQDTYPGLNAFSEPETQALRDLAIQQNFTASISWHSGVAMILYPWGYSTSVKTSDDALLNSIAANMSSVSSYSYYQSSELYPATGDSDDWLYGEQRLKRKTYPFTVEVYGGSGSYWDYFNPLVSEVESVCERNKNLSLYLAEVAGELVENESKSWTFMVYMAADNNLESAGIDDLNEMEAVGSTGEVNIVVQFDRHPFYDSTNGDWTTTRRYYVTQDSNSSAINSTLIADLGEKNMGDAETLVNFVNWSIQNYPAQHYALVLWNHGDGWTRKQMTSSLVHKGVAWDSSNGNDYLTMSELKMAFTSIQNETNATLDVVGFDACLMGMAEVCYQVMPYAGYCVASEEGEPEDGWEYNYTLSKLVSNPGMSASELSTHIVGDFVESYNGTPDESYVTQSAVNLSRMPDLVDALDLFAASLINTSSSFNEIKQARDVVDYYATPSYVDLYDLARLTENKSTDDGVRSPSLSLMQEVNETVVAEAHGFGHVDSHGVSIYFPSTVSAYSGSYNTSLDFTRDTIWNQFLLTYYYADYELPSAPVLNYTVVNTSILLSWSNASDDRGIQCYGLQESSNGSWTDLVDCTPNQTYSLSSRPDSVYSFRVRAKDTGNNYGNWSNTVNATVDTSPPRVIEVSPGNNSVTSGPDIDLNIVFSDLTGLNESGLLLSIDNSTVALNVSALNSSAYVVSASNLSLGDGLRNASLTASDVLGYSMTDSYNWSFTVDSIQPNLSLNISLDGGNYTVSSSDVVFYYTPSDNLGLANCSLYGNFTGEWALNQTDGNVSTNSVNNITLLGLPEGIYGWNIQCFDLAGNAVELDGNKTLIVDTTDYVPLSLGVGWNLISMPLNS